VSDPSFERADVPVSDRAAALVHYTYALAWFDHGGGMLECCVRYAEGMERHCFWRDAFPAQALKGAGTYRVY
jgi:hypothetical protein